MLDILDTQILEDERAAVNVSAPLKSTNASHSRRLPRIKLPKFSGEYAQWSQLRDLITSMILGNNDLSDVEKLHYLKMSLTGEPSQLLKNVTVAGENLTRSWDTLVA